ncbi:MAG: maltose alpha-D-glucosyltransferase [Dermatophilaceae bacterium]|nr:maltose alpha-D-glucosyltransferase [Dermatophilaceae bacterium]
MTESGLTDNGENRDEATPEEATPEEIISEVTAPEDVTEPTPHEPSEITFAEQFYPARPRHLRPKARLRGATTPTAEMLGEPVGSNPSYVAWLRQESMLNDANVIARQFVGRGSMFQNPFARPDPRSAIETASVWFTAYPISVIGRPGRSFLATLGDPELWETFQRIGIQGLHTGPVKRAGGIRGWSPTPSVDGHFDRISTQIDPAFGTEAEFRTMCEIAGEHNGTIIDDIVPGHTGKGADFRLAEMKVTNYPGIYHMVEIDPADWHLLPEVPEGRDSTNINVETEDQLSKYGYIVGKLQRVIFHEPGVKDTNWSTTAPVVGPDGVERRWVYLHYFKQGQPSINWLDPSFAGVRMVIGDALHSLTDLGSGALRLDANGFLGVEKSAQGLPAWSEGHPLSEAANQLVASMVRKVGGFTFQELNLTIEDIKMTSEAGADLSYDFVNRPAYHHALAMGDTEFLRLTLNTSLELGVNPIQLVHALQNHDDLTYELVHFATLHRDDVYSYHGEDISGGDLAVKIRGDLCDRLTGDAAPYNQIFSTNGIASTTGTVIAAALGYTSIDNLSHHQIRKIRQAHLLLAMFNALQPGVFSLSGWDLLGMLTLAPERIAPLLATGDTRWINRSAYDLMGFRPESEEPRVGMPEAVSMYGPLPQQLKDQWSFVSQLRQILRLREQYGIATSTQVDVPEVSNKAMLVMVHQLANPLEHQVTVLNFGSEAVVGTINSTHLDAGSPVLDMFTDEVIGEVDDLHSFSIALDGYQGRSLFLAPRDDAGPVA